MSEKLFVNEEKESFNGPQDTSVNSKTTRKRVMIGSIIGGCVFIGAILAVFILVTSGTEEARFASNPPDPSSKVPYYNPFVVENVKILEKAIKIDLINKRKEIEGDSNSYTRDGGVPIVVNTTENFEPPRLTFYVVEQDEHLTRFIFDDPESSRWHVPSFESSPDPDTKTTQHIRNPSGFDIIENFNKTLEWSFTGSSKKLIHTKNCRLQYFDKYIEFEGILPQSYIYGMGERIESFLLKDNNYSMWNRYYPYRISDDPENGMYGSHPFILTHARNDKTSEFTGIFMRNSNAMLFSSWRTEKDGTFINYKMIGGIIDLYLFHSTDAQHILRKYHSVIGRPYLPAFWAMGFHQARAGYKESDLREIIKKSSEFKTPVDALWVDAEINDQHKTFTVNSNTFGGIKELVKEMHDPRVGIDMHFVPIANPALKVDPNYRYYKEALDMDALIRSAVNYGLPFEGRTMAGTTSWLDFFSHEATLLWAGGLHDFHEQTDFDGIWMSENEIYQLCSGECYNTDTSADLKNSIPNPFHNASEFDHIQFRPTLDSLQADTLHMAAYHSGNAMFNKQYYTHNLYSIQSAYATFDSLKGIFEAARFFVASRSTWVGSGHVSSHWLDGNYGTWDSMASSITGMLNFNLFGIPHVGAPIGGHFGNCDGELLVRWYELGTFSPLMLSYSDLDTNRKEPFADPSLVSIIRNVMLERYKLVRFMYTKMFEAHAWGGAVIHPLFFDFPKDLELFRSEITDKTFMWSHSLYVIPTLIPHAEYIRAYLPNWRWYDLRTKEMVVDYSKLFERGTYHTFASPLGITTVLIKGGTIIPYQNLANEAKVMNVGDLGMLPMQIIVAPDHEDKAEGTMIVDSQKIAPYPDEKSNSYRHYSFSYMNKTFKVNKLAGFDFPMNYEFEGLRELYILDIFGSDHTDELEMTDPKFVCMMDTNMNKRELAFSRSTYSCRLSIHAPGLERIPMASIETITWGTSKDHNLCKNQLVIKTMMESMNGKMLTASIEDANVEFAQTKLEFIAVAMNDHDVYLRIKNAEENEWKVPQIVSEHQKLSPRSTKSLKAVGFATSKVDAPFYFEMTEGDDSHDFLLTTKNQPFDYLKNFIQVKFMAAAEHVFGLGDHMGKFDLADGTYSLWNYNSMRGDMDGFGGNNRHSSHPFYLIHTHNPKNFAGVFFLTSNPMDVKIKHVDKQTEIDNILTSGMIEVFFLGKGPAEDVLRRYHDLIGKPAPMPFWAFGYHQSRLGYKDIHHMKAVVHNFDANAIPLDVVWADRDLMDNSKSFTVNTRKWFGMNEFIKELHGSGKHFVATVNAATAIDYNFDLFLNGLSYNVYIKSSHTKDIIVGITWAGYSTWIDFIHPAATQFWSECLKYLYAKVEFDGIWLDMNEPNNFCDGECPDKSSYNYFTFPLNYYNNLYYTPTHRPLEEKTISMDALHEGNPKYATEFNYHSLYGLKQSVETYSYFDMVKRGRPFIVSTSTYPRSGHYVGHTLGENFSTWKDMKHSIAGILNFNMFGIPFVGANVCGYKGNATIDLCARWMQLGAFYPFMRNHNSPESSPQEPFIDPELMEVSKKALRTRYSLARYMYTAHMQTVLNGGSMVQPLLFSFPEDTNIYENIDTTFMLGSGLRVTPILEEKKNSVESYFPNADWYTFKGPDYKKVLSYDPKSNKGRKIELYSPLKDGTLNLHVRSGAIVCTQEVNAGITNINKLHDLPIRLVVVPDHQLSADGKIYYDSADAYTNLLMKLDKNQITVSLANGAYGINYSKADKFVSEILILGASSYKNVTTARYETLNGHIFRIKLVAYDEAREILVLKTFDDAPMNLLDLKTISWS